MRVTEICESSITLEVNMVELRDLALACNCACGHEDRAHDFDKFETLASFFEALSVVGTVYGHTNDERYRSPLESLRAGAFFD